MIYNDYTDVPIAIGMITPVCLSLGICHLSFFFNIYDFQTLKLSNVATTAFANKRLIRN